MGVPSGGFYHATDQKQVLSSKKARLGTSHVLQRKIEAQQVIQFPGNIKTSYSTCRISPSSVSKSGSNVPSFAWSKSSSSSSSTPSSSSILTCRAGSCGSSLRPWPPRRIFALWKVLEAERLRTKVGVLNSPSSCQQKMDCPAMALWAVLSNTRTVINISYENMTKFYKVSRTHTCRQGSQVTEWRPPPHPPPSFLQDT